MSPALVISKREIRTYFNSPIAYIVVTVFTIITGYLFFTQLFIEKQADMRGLFGVMPLLFMFLVPAITMRLLAEEKGSGTLELLITMPVRDWEIVVGKFLAALALICTALALTLVFALTVKSMGPLDKGPTIGGYIGLVLMGGAYASIGLMASSYTRNQIVAFIVSFAICFALYLLGRISQFVPESLQGLFSFLSIDTHFENISRGVIDSRDVIYYVSVMAVCLLLATLSLESRKWR
ncbi:MAG: gliding motility-associated transport system permease protein [Myxococcales bacterium]|jgi:ABC-2 type transport system permease protein|nr:gliding motility-associated transport system permease protein [Myxococcales bacterium]